MGGQAFIVQKHAASHLHYDFRLEMDGVLKSWAVAKGPSVDPAVKRLAIEVEDHPLAYGNFEGTIPKGQYGGGTVMLWDRGTWHPMEDARKGFKAGRLKFRLDGEKMKGLWALVRMKPRPKDRHPNWLLIKDKDRAAAPGAPDSLLKKAKSVKTQRTMQAIANGNSDVWNSKSESKPAKKAARTAPPTKSGMVHRGKKHADPPPEFIAPQLATRVDAPPDGETWLHEIKFDGYRIHIRIEAGKLRILTRRGEDWTDKFKDLVAELAVLAVDNIYMDGEVVALDKAGLTDFGALQNWFKAPSGKSIAYYAFDLLFLDGQDLREQPLTVRKEMLRELLDKASLQHVRYSDHQFGHGAAFFKAADALGVEGIVSKAADDAYFSGRSRSWLKIKRIERQEFVIGGYTLSTKSDTAIGALHLGEYQGKDLVYIGKVGTGFSSDLARALLKKLAKLAATKPPFVRVPPEVRRQAHWTKPALVAEIEFGAWTSDHILRHSAFLGLREDKKPHDVKPERPLPVEDVAQTIDKKTPPRHSTKATDGENTVAGVAISHPDRVIYRKEHISKVDVARYYEAVAEVMLPLIAERPLTLLRCPDGVGPACFFQKHAGMGLPEAIREERIGSGKGDAVLVINSAEGLVSLVQRGVLEIHTWGAHMDHVEQPDLIVFDLDPDPALKWPVVVNAATGLRDMLKDLRLTSFVKTTGGKGLHVVVPVKPHLEWDAVKQFAKIVAERFAARDPSAYVTNMSQKVRGGHIFIDYLRNGRGATFVAPYSTRARPGAQIATPLSWDELEDGATPRDFTLYSVLKRLSGLFTDPWAAMAKSRQQITVKIIEALSRD